ncbi:hypothetical protein BO94DRAFT_628485 [Aspergillus sclerotioniger CBS 115572]|uniref:C2H2-type domain-containing protein n=1 Tax=Aspergillus sclerotioniger CBS 115572 TaxID=1450535 RepID=A0A317V9E7_9EURO|nr:hypothetical protein BO94DRAFT_628485 [Aspergillus sclerotioniger CBS 115572]PWY69658.1 hypothetical protein BO94DRAFT_628485 [Aspergillus sclerotioniger CBS 115572]
MMASPTEIPTDRFSHDAAFIHVTPNDDENRAMQYHHSETANQSNRHVQRLANMSFLRSECPTPTYHPHWTYFRAPPNPSRNAYQIPAYDGTSLGPNHALTGYIRNGNDEQIGVPSSRHLSGGRHGSHPHRTSMNGVARGSLDTRYRVQRAQPYATNCRTSNLICEWNGCTYAHPFNRAADLIRHVRNIHVSPDSFPCWVPGCDRSFNRSDNLMEHLSRVHQVEREGQSQRSLIDNQHQLRDYY